MLLEYASVITNPKLVASPRSPEEAWAEVAKLRSALPVLFPPPTYLDRLQELAAKIRPKGPEVFDAAIAAAVIAAGMTEIYTYDAAIFGRVPGISVLVP